MISCILCYITDEKKKHFDCLNESVTLLGIRSYIGLFQKCSCLFFSLLYNGSYLKDSQEKMKTGLKYLYQTNNSSSCQRLILLNCLPQAIYQINDDGETELRVYWKLLLKEEIETKSSWESLACLLLNFAY